MINKPEAPRSEKLPHWIPDRVQGVLRRTLSKEPIDLTSPEVIGRHFASQAEIEDVYEVINQVENPILIGINGSRASLIHLPLFEGVEAFDLYHSEKARREGDLEEYLFQNGLSIRDYKLARRYLEQLGFNERYRQGQKYPAPIVELLVRDIDLIIIAGGKHIRGGPNKGKGTNVPLDIGVNSPYHMFESDPKDLESYLQRGLEVAVPLKYR